jgi:hypothetical protein
MTTSPAATGTTRTVRTGRQTFVAAVVAFVVAFVAVAQRSRCSTSIAPRTASRTPRYPWRSSRTLRRHSSPWRRWGACRTFSAASRLYRQPHAALVGCVLFLYAHESAVLIAARFVMGVEVGRALRVVGTPDARLVFWVLVAISAAPTSVGCVLFAKGRTPQEAR